MVRAAQLTSDHDAPLASVLERNETAHFDRLGRLIDDDGLERVLVQDVLASTREGCTDDISLLEDGLTRRTPCAVQVAGSVSSGVLCL
jgi:hypothetical protein